MTYLYGLTHSNKDFESGDAFGKNTFTTAFPIALANYLACEKNLPMNYIVADLGEGDAPTTKHKLTPLKDIIGCDPYDAEYHFEDSFEQYSQYAVNEANRSDIVVKNRITGDEVSAFEVNSLRCRPPAPQECLETNNAASWLFAHRLSSSSVFRLPHRLAPCADKKSVKLLLLN